jgi:dipeptidyl aminopeptidase/acylaminoacyl peptidase
MVLRSRFATIAILLMLLLAATVARPVPKGSAGTRLLADEVWSPAPWSALAAGPKRDVGRYADSAAYETARNDTAFDARRWRYPSDSAEVVALVMRARTAARRPAIVYCRGSFIQQGQLDGFLPLLHRLARAGYLVVAPQYRGSEGGTGRDEMGGADVEDVLAVVRLLAARPEVDARAIYLYGESRGGMMTLQAIRDGAPVRAAATVGAFTDLDSLFAADQRSASMATRIWPDYDSRRDEIAFRRSAARWAERVQVPLLILHGANDGGVPPRQSEQLAAALARAKAPHELRIVAGGSHTLAERSASRDSMVVHWFRTHAP